jgi:uncharacterized membrane protein YkoI
MLSVGLALLVLVVAARPAAAQRISFKEAYKIAQERVPNGVLLFGHFERGNPPKWGFYFLVGKGIIETEIRISGQLAMMENLPQAKIDQKFDAKVLAALGSTTRAKLPYAEFMQIASDQAKGGDVTAVQVTLADGQLVLDVSVGSSTVRIDMATGQVLQGKG